MRQAACLWVGGPSLSLRPGEELKGKHHHPAQGGRIKKGEFAVVTLRAARGRAPDSAVVSSPHKPRGNPVIMCDESLNV